ncbi:hypothetical protein RYH80_09905 [Halobaculum sp. MBLA0147]|uniref:hypothetical protein n=1 Tax=Halobaculum sp. MBLA0147 TaxID=3079934 RepID=UPI003524374E
MSTSDPTEFEPEVDLLRRYERMIQTQVETLTSIDQKAARVARLIGLLIGVVLSAVSIVVGSGAEIQTNELLLTAHSAVAGVALSVALTQAVITYLSSTFEYGPSSELGSFMSEHRVTQTDYKNHLLRGYSSAVERNHGVVVANARRFQRCLASFLVGIVFTATASVVLVATPNRPVAVSTSVMAVAIAGVLAHYVTREEYLTLGRQL